MSKKQPDRTTPARPMLGTDFTTLQRIGRTTPPAMSYYLGVAPNKLTTLKAAGPNGFAPKFGLILRYLLSHPEKLPRIQSPSPAELLAKIRKHRPRMGEEYFARLLGYQKGAQIRLFSSDPEKLPVTVRRYMLLISEAIDEDPKNLDEFIRIAEDEATARGQDPYDMWVHGWKLFNDED